MTGAGHLYGTDEPPAPNRRLRAGRLSMELEGGNLRAIRWDGVELIRGIAFLARSTTWATPAPVLSDETICETPDGFVLGYRATVNCDGQTLAYDARIAAHASGRLSFRVTARAEADFRTNRTGFVVLHAAGLAGRDAEIEHTDGRCERVRFPELIAPHQPMRDLRAITHEAAPGLGVTCRMTGETFEMEDQRNWTDASFKTYCRPLERPWPYTLPSGAEETQEVTVTVATAPRAPAVHAVAAPDAVIVRAGTPAGTMPSIGLGCTPEEAAAALPLVAVLHPLGIRVLVCRYDTGVGHTPAALRDFAALASALDADIELQLVVQSADDAATELSALAAQLAESGVRPRAVLVAPAADLRAAPGLPLPELYRAARGAFPTARLGGGTFCGFTELNRRRPSPDDIDLVTFSTSAIVHAADDRSVIETLEALPAVAASARAIAGVRPYVVGPSAIGLRDNPAGTPPLPNPRGLRQPMSGFDPRQRRQFNAAWTLGAVTAFAYGGASRVAFSAPAGDFGIVHDGAPLPVAWVLSRCAGLSGQSLLAVEPRPPIVALAATGADGTWVLLGNASAAPVDVELVEAASDAPRRRMPLALDAFGTRAVAL